MEILSSSASEEILHAVEVEAEGEAHGLVEGVGLCGGEDVGGVEGEDAHLEARAGSDVLAVALVLVLVVIAEAYEEAVVVGVLSTEAPLNLLHLFLEAVGRVVEALEDTCDGRDVPVFSLHAFGVLLAGLFGFDKMTKLEAEAGAEKAPQVKF